MADTNQTERVGVNAVGAIFLSMGWIFREQTISDYGIDAHVEPKDDGIPTGQLIALQIKTGDSHFRKRGDNYVFYGERAYLDYPKGQGTGRGGAQVRRQLSQSRAGVPRCRQFRASSNSFR